MFQAFGVKDMTAREAAFVIATDALRIAHDSLHKHEALFDISGKEFDLVQNHLAKLHNGLWQRSKMSGGDGYLPTTEK